MVVIVNKDRNELFNLEHIGNVYIGSDRVSIKAVIGTTRGGNLGSYRTYEAAVKAMEVLVENIVRDGVKIIYMPSDEEIENKMRTKTVYHHATGKKTKGHGGS